MIAVTCPTGRIAGILVPRLLRRGHPVRVLCRAPSHVEGLSALGAEVIRGSIFDPDRVELFLRDARSTFLVTPLFDNPSDELSAGGAIASAHVGSTVDHLAYLTILGSDRGSGAASSIAAKAEVEQQLADTGIDFTFVHAAFLMENLTLLRSELDLGVLSLPVPADQPFPLVAASDVACSALLALARGPAGAQRLAVTGPEILTPEEMAAAFSQALGHPVRAVEVKVGDYGQRLADAGVPHHRAAHLAELAAHMAELEWNEAPGSALAALGGTPTSFEAFTQGLVGKRYARFS
jgi:uncharacterized protein YbjT (DUF2867 family)